MGFIINTDFKESNSSSNRSSYSPSSNSNSSSNNSSPNFKLNKNMKTSKSYPLLNNNTSAISIPSSNSFGSSCTLLDTNTNNSIPQLAINNNTEITRKDIEKIIGMKPLDLNKYKQAFVHKSIVKSAKENNSFPKYMHNSYERYEFLGDSVLNLVIAKYLFNKYPNEHEGHLTKIRTKLVNGKNFIIFSRKIKFK